MLLKQFLTKISNMKKALFQFSATLLMVVSLSFTACKSGPKDSDIQEDFNEKMTANPQLRTITATVSEGVVTLTGTCPDEPCRTSAEQAAREVKGVKNVVNNISVTPSAPVVISDDATLKNAVDEIIDDYDNVEADVQNGEVTLRGTIERDKLQKLMMDLNAANAKKINNQLTIK
jgi:hyperosmotically inducible periplasmic protein